MEKVLVIAPHTDDEVLGVGGTIIKYLNDSHKVHVCFVALRETSSKRTQHREARDAKKGALGLRNERTIISTTKFYYN